MADTKTAEKKPEAAEKPVSEGRVTLRYSSESLVGNTWNVRTESGTTLEQIIAPSFWAHVAARFRTGDKLIVWCDDGSYYAEFVVRQAYPTAAFVRKIVWDNWDDPIAAVKDSDHSHEVRWLGKEKQWCVIEKKSMRPVFENLPDKPTAESQLEAYLRRRAA